jgi:hypothetical protein
MIMLNKKFAYHRPGPSSGQKCDKLRAAYSALLDVINEVCPPNGERPHSREAAVAITELETSAMWAIKAVVANDPESEVTL